MATTEQIRRAMLDGAERALREIGEDLLGRSQRDAPILTGHLRGSGTSQIDRQADGVQLRVSFSTPYAARQHEELDWQHPRGGKAKYLEDNYLSMLPRYNNALQASVARELEQLR